jgi:hypothetical protein
LGLHYIETYDAFDHIDVAKIAFEQAENNNIESVVRLIGKRSKYAREKKEKIQKEIISELLAKNFTKHSKVAENLCEKFDIPLENYPDLVENKIRGGVRFFLNNFLRKKEDDKEYMGLDRVENLFDGIKECQAHLCEQLWFAGKKMEAKGVFERQKLKPEEVSKLSKNKKVGDEIKAFKYDKTKDFKPIKDYFEPVSLPSTDYLRMPPSIKMEFIDNEQKVAQLEDLKGQKFIGVDAEWRPQVHKWQKQNGPAILQIAGKGEAFIIDILKLSKSQKLDKVLKEIFTHKDSIIVGFGFTSDLSMFRKFCPQMKFIDSIPRFVDAQEFYKAVYPDFKD